MYVLPFFEGLNGQTTFFAYLPCGALPPFQNDQKWSKMGNFLPSYSSIDVSRDGKEGTA